MSAGGLSLRERRLWRRRRQPRRHCRKHQPVQLHRSRGSLILQSGSPISRISKKDEPINITYPDADSPGVLIKLGAPVEGGVGPDRDIVAFSTMCPHKGFPLFYRADDHSLNCPGHYSRFDVERGGEQIWGHATQNLPQFRLRIDEAGDIYAEAVDELIYGRLSNVLKS
jgi:arsenite oxidase small subunit